ncbi:MAG: metalloregulator ArsR/SmtB family transcription factor [Gammaproteobacteria bacterium]|nr:metalloregulator ArsR/SmtB family transcription factor [Gammaproteobacteria bacterium]NNC66841.1 winged helix-turn-helix transcriptional regulator [Gammaproteobacteria bacterium]
MLEQRENVAQILKTIAHEARLMILCLLVKNEMTVSQINEFVELSQSALSQHLAVLRQHNLVQTRRESQTIYYRLADKDLSHIVTSLHDVFCKYK